MINKDLNIYSDLLTWLNGRMEKIEIIHKEKLVKIWSCKNDISIEDSVLNFCKKNDIDIKTEILFGYSNTIEVKNE